MDRPPSDFSSSGTPSNFGGGRQGFPQISMEQLQWLMKIMSSDDRTAVASEMRKCSTEMTLTRGLPLAVGLMGGMYYARKRLPTQYHFGPKGWPLYALLGFGSVTLANLLTANTCADRVRPILWKMFQKYDMGETKSSNSYESLRVANRARLRGEGVGGLPSQIGPASSRYDLARGPVQQSNYRESSVGESSPYSRQPPSSYKTRYPEEHWVSELSKLPQTETGEDSLMSGTPYENPSSYQDDTYATSTESKSPYGDSGFSITGK